MQTSSRVFIKPTLFEPPQKYQDYWCRKISNTDISKGLRMKYAVDIRIKELVG